MKACIGSIEKKGENGQLYADFGLNAFLSRIAEKHPSRDEILFLCIGTDRSTGDSFGPLLGTMLRAQGWPYVVGTLDEPCDAYRVEQAVRAAIAEHAVVIAVDACLGKAQSVGGYLVAEGPLKPGQATGANLPEAGHYSIAGIVNGMSHKPYMTLQTTPLHRVLQMASGLADAIEAAWKDSAKKPTNARYGT
ncbi:spore protease YyaC [Paenibacillus radicis (ex Gao et al. 2016)]|uniref:Spore protease YyaC n=1 Tax=Paenibacillus radicis (ex Gao et al. 2016) TaxID=1737354 RepID=A0A917HKG3_9BACL|nr:spore protease YyaC [Paenibacillus radicis (ex Gao et al. 2016)]